MLLENNVAVTYGGGGFKAFLDALESLRRHRACELGTYRTRVVTLKTGGVPESILEHVEVRDSIAEPIVD